MVTHKGGCHCRKVRFEVEAPSELVAWDCNCSICRLKRNTHFIVPTSQFRLDPDSRQHVGEYTFGTHTAKHLFCKHCGICCHYVPRSNPQGVAVTVHCLDPGTVIKLTVKQFDGQNWEQAYHGTGIASATPYP